MQMIQRLRSLSFWMLAIPGAACMVFVVRYIVCVPVGVFVHVEPEQLFADPSSSVAVTVSEHNRLGFQTPFRRAKLRCRFDEGKELCVLEYRDDSTRVIVRSTGEPGEVALVIVTDASRFPLYLHLVVQPLIVMATRAVTGPADRNRYASFREIPTRGAPGTMLSITMNGPTWINPRFTEASRRWSKTSACSPVKGEAVPVSACGWNHEDQSRNLEALRGISKSLRPPDCGRGPVEEFFHHDATV